MRRLKQKQRESAPLQGMRAARGTRMGQKTSN
jgi:hypothetical protein